MGCYNGYYNGLYPHLVPLSSVVGPFLSFELLVLLVVYVILLVVIFRFVLFQMQYDPLPNVVVALLLDVHAPLLDVLTLLPVPTWLHLTTTFPVVIAPKRLARPVISFVLLLLVVFFVLLVGLAIVAVVTSLRPTNLFVVHLCRLFSHLHLHLSLLLVHDQSHPQRLTLPFLYLLLLHWHHWQSHFSGHCLYHYWQWY